MTGQTTCRILMIRPANFGYNAETAQNNAFQEQPQSAGAEAIARAALQEFDALAEALDKAGVEVYVVEDTPEPVKPDAVFPNNWVSFHQDGSVITWPMFSPLRRAERREEIIHELARTFAFKERIHLEYFEQQNRFLEGTGSLILDRVYKIAYACRSIRTDEVVLDEFCRMKGYEKLVFDATDSNGTPVYHTNVMMALGRELAVVCMDAIRDEQQRRAVLDKLEATQKSLLNISLPQMNSFAGNMLEVKTKAGSPLFVMSRAAWDCLSPAQRRQIEATAQPLFSDLQTIERYGGGSARCMLAEIFAGESR